MANSERSKAFIYKKYYGYVMAVALRYISQSMDAEEAVNESFVKAFRKLDGFEQHPEDAVLEKTFKSWMARIAVNTSIDLLRTKKQALSFEDTDDESPLADTVLVTDKLAAQDILKLLEKIPALQRSIFNLFEIEGYSHEEIGQMLDIPESTSRTYLTRAKQRLRKLYVEEFGALRNVNA
ncbi:RNA polymerase sigma factor [Sphingobacterium sp. MYb382]|uniref:RNA polymerase sigma factor n=1 Tax=Sphingobacterium sp. MYb382 TaxID=2745278 RepID=UPI0030B4510C